MPEGEKNGMPVVIDAHNLPSPGLNRVSICQKLGGPVAPLAPPAPPVPASLERSGAGKEVLTILRDNLMEINYATLTLLRIKQ